MSAKRGLACPALRRIKVEMKENVFARPQSSVSQSSNPPNDLIETNTHDVFIVCELSKPNADVSPAIRPTIRWAKPVPKYTRHNNLDISPLTPRQWLHLARLRYLNMANLIRLTTTVFCLSWCLFTWQKVIGEFREHETIVFVEYQQPGISNPPGITVCTHCVLCS